MEDAPAPSLYLVLRRGGVGGCNKERTGGRLRSFVLVLISGAMDSVDLEADTLRERKIGAVVDRVGGAPHVLLPGVGAGFPAPSGLFLAAEGPADLRA